MFKMDDLFKAGLRITYLLFPIFPTSTGRYVLIHGDPRGPTHKIRLFAGVWPLYTWLDLDPVFKEKSNG